MILKTLAKENTGPSQSEIATIEDFKEIYQLYWKRIFGLAYHRVHSKHLAENIVQDVFTSLWLRQSNNDNAPVRDVYAWLAAAAKYAILRQTSISQKQKTEALNSDIGPSTANPVDLLFIDKMLAREINRLPQKCKLVFQYSRGKELPNKEIAKQLNLSEKTVEKHISTAIRKLRHRLKDFFAV